MMKTIAILALVMSATTYAATDEFARVEIKGTLHNDVKEHRTTIKANGSVYELNFGKNDDLYRQAERLDRHIVVVNGEIMLDQDKTGTFVVVMPSRIADVSPENVTYERRETIVEPPPVRERVIIKERRDPIFKAGPLEIRP